MSLTFRDGHRRLAGGRAPRGRKWWQARNVKTGIESTMMDEDEEDTDEETRGGKARRRTTSRARMREDIEETASHGEQERMNKHMRSTTRAQVGNLTGTSTLATGFADGRGTCSDPEGPRSRMSSDASTSTGVGIS